MTEEEIRREKELRRQDKRKAREEEREKIRTLKGTERLRYFWDYYKIVPILLFFLILVLYIIARIIIGSRTKTLLYTCILNDPQINGEESRLPEDFESSIGGTSRWEQIVFDTSIMVDPESSGTSQIDVANTMKMTALLQNKMADVFIASGSVTAYLLEEGLLQELDELPQAGLPDTEASGTGLLATEALDTEVSGTEASGTGLSDIEALDAEASDAGLPFMLLPEDWLLRSGSHIYAVRLDQAEAFQKYGYHAEDGIWFSVVGNTEREEMALRLLSFLLGENG